MSVKAKDIRESLIAQLEAKGANVAHFEALLDDYMFYTDMIKKLKKDIKKRGLYFESISASGKEYEKENPSVKLLPQYTRQQLQILKELQLTVDEPLKDEDDEL